ncbi:MAG: 4-hydroxybutyrate CoA-transferase [Defluviitaleaceae bacterium]|nr:4-hydroxybutyrate CoA-transferase [Defluviitaleaceae bacterium]
MAKFITAKEAVLNIKSGDRVVISHACAEPQALVGAMVENAAAYKNVEIVHMVAMGKSTYCLPEYRENFIHNGLFLSASTRLAVEEGRADYTPSFFFEIPRLFKNNILPVDVALISVSPPDKFGYCSLGVSVDYTKAAAQCAKTVIALINDKMPRTGGDSLIHIDDIDFAVELSEELIELPRPAIGDVEKKIGEYCASLIKDGATLQLGIGAIPDAVLTFLDKKKDLGIHSEMFSDGVLDLVEKGVITNKAKSIQKSKFIAAFLMGSKRLYDFVDNNPMVEMHPVDYVNHPIIVSQNYRMTSINSAIQIDLMGQVNAESIGSKQFSGTGGQVDFVRGTSMCEDGVSIIAMPSTAAKGKLSRIVSVLDEGAALTTSRNDVHYVVTEYGIAELRGKSLRKRAEALIEIAHPDFRDAL